MLKDMTRFQEVLAIFEDAFGVFVTDSEGIIQEVNQRFCDLSAYKRTDLLKQSYQTIHLQIDKIEDFHPTVRRGDVWQGPVQYKTKDQAWKWLYFIVIPIFNENTETYHYMTFSNDMMNYIEMEKVMNETLNSPKSINNALDEASIVAITDKKGVIIHVNDKFCRVSQYNREELIGKTHSVINSNYHPESFFAEMWKTILSGETWSGEIRNRAKDGTYYWMNTIIVPILNRSGEIYQFISIRTDITLRIQAENELARVMDGDFKKVVQNLQNWVVKLKRDEQQNIQVVLSEGRLAKELGIVTNVVHNKKICEVLHGELTQRLERGLGEAFDGKLTRLETTYQDRYIDVMLSPVIENEEVIEVVGSISDITDRKKAEETILHMAQHDTLTKLSNRNHFARLLEAAIVRSKQKSEGLAVMYLDLDRFKSINDSLGHLTGDRVLKRVATYLEKSVRKYDVVSRQGGDEFTIFLPDIDRKEAADVAGRIMKMFSVPMKIEHLELQVTSSIGISMYPEDGETVEKLMRNADAAMYLAKHSGRNNYQFYTGELPKSIL